MLQYLFYLDFYFLIFRNDIKKRWLFVCCDVFPGSVNMTMSSLV